MATLMATSLSRYARRFQHNWQIHPFTDAASVLSAARELRCGINLLVTDVQMPGIPGDELIRQIRRTCPHIDVLAVSGALPQGGAALGNIPILRKPFEMTALAEAVKDILATQLI